MPDFLADSLTWPKHYHIALAVQTAMDLHLPPTFMLLEGKQPTDPWSRHDKKLAVAWTIMNKETCPKCGQPIWICRSSDKNLGFSVKVGLCYASAELEKWQDSKRGKNLKKGEYPYVVPTMYDDSPLPSRLDYLNGLDE